VLPLHCLAIQARRKRGICAIRPDL
jgi:hypothetical protein